VAPGGLCGGGSVRVAKHMMISAAAGAQLER
jgi:hypothetical protein